MKSDKKIPFWIYQKERAFVVTVNGLFDVGHTGVANFDC